MFLDPSTTALILIDLQEGIVSLPLEPYSGKDIVQHSKQLAQTFRHAGAPVFLINVSFSQNGSDALKMPVDRPLSKPDTILPPNWANLVDNLKKPGDICITKHQWGAFFGTELDLQLRRRGITSIVLGGIATNFGVESTARSAYEHGYHIVFAKDLTSSLSANMHDFAYQNIFPAIGQVRNSNGITFGK